MKTILLTFLVIFVLLVAVVPVFAAGSLPRLDSPLQGDVLQGQVSVTGFTAIEDFASYDVLFAYAGQENPQWFLITSSTAAVEDGELAIWDTTTITDGNYQLRLRVYRADGSEAIVLVDNLFIRNYSPVETPSSPDSTTGQITPTSVIKVTEKSPILVHPTPVPLPPNPAAVTPASVRWVIMVGAALGGLSLLLLAIYTAASAMLRR